MSRNLFRAEDMIVDMISDEIYYDECDGIIDQIWANYYGYVEDEWF